jgi:hypothetical protein
MSRAGSAVAPSPAPGNKVLVLQTATPSRILRVLDDLRERGIFGEVRCTLFCRNDPEALRAFRRHAMVSELRVHTEARHGWRHWRELRREKYDWLVLFLGGDRGYWKMKGLALMLDSRNIVIFDAGDNCFCLSGRAWPAVLALRACRRSLSVGPPQAGLQAGAVLRKLLKLLLLPFRVVWLLGVWLHLRGTAKRVK